MLLKTLLLKTKKLINISAVIISDSLKKLDKLIEPGILQIDSIILSVPRTFLKRVLNPAIAKISKSGSKQDNKLKFTAIIKNIFVQIIGKISISYRSPKWLVYCKEKYLQFNNWLNSRNALKIRIRVFSFLVVICIIIIFSVQKIMERWEASAISFNITKPVPTKLEKGAVPDHLEIHFSRSSAKLSDVKKRVVTGVTIEPAIKGFWLWENDSTLKFSPEEEWRVGQEYKVQFEHSLFPEQVMLKTYKGYFKTDDFKAKLGDFKFHIDPQNPNIKKTVATIKFSHPVDKESFHDSISMSFNDEKIKFTVLYDEYKGTAYIHSDSIVLLEKESQVSLFIDNDYKSSLGGPDVVNEIDTDIAIPSKFEIFQIGSVELSTAENEFSEVEQIAIVETTLEVNAEHLLNNMTAYLLPQDYPEYGGREKEINYEWRGPEEVDPEILRLSKKIEMTVIPGENDYLKINTFKHNADENRYLYIKIKKNTRSYAGFYLQKDYEDVIKIPEIPRDLKILHSGAVLCLSGDKKLSMMAYDVDTVRIEIGRVIPDQLNHLISQSTGAFQNPDFSCYRFDKNNISEMYYEIANLGKKETGKRQYFSFDFSRYLQRQSMRVRHGLFIIKIISCEYGVNCDLDGKDRPPKKNNYSEFYFKDNEESDSGDNDDSGSSYKRVVSDYRFILVTDLGLLVKKASTGSLDVFVQSIYNGQPVQGADVSVLGENGLSIASSVTDERGHSILPPLDTYKRDKSPTTIIVRKDEDLSFIPYSRTDRNLNFSRYDIGGLHGFSNTSRLLAFPFTDRGIYRPGDLCNVGIIIKPANWFKDITGVPIEAVIRDARSMDVYTQKIKLDQSGVYTMQYTLQDTSLTGNYNIEIYIPTGNGNRILIGSTSFKVEEFTPDRMKISTTLSRTTDRGWVTPDLTGKVSLQNLYGTPAVNRKITAKIKLEPALFSFNEYSAYKFFDPSRTEKVYEDDMGELLSDKNGEAVFTFGLDRFEKASYRLTFRAEGFYLDGGKAVTTESSVLVSPLKYMVGFNTGNDLTYIMKGSQVPASIIAIDHNVKKTTVKDIIYRLIEIRHLSVLTKQEDGVYRYQSIDKEEELLKNKFTILTDGYSYMLPTTNAGDFVVRIEDNEGTVLNEIKYTVVGQGNLSFKLERNEELQLRLNKNDYYPGESIQLYIRAPYTGHGLITIEKEKVYAFKWFKTTTNSSIQTIEVPQSLEGNGYVNVSFIRSIDSPEIYTSPLSYSVAPFSVNKERHNNKITLSCKDIARPGKPFRIYYQTNRPGKIIIYAVDEGILQVVSYKLPDPLSYFCKKRALEVGTSQIVDLILPEYSIVKRFSPFGGDEWLAILKNLNPFKSKRHKPVVFWSGVIDADSSVRYVDYNIPDYFNGTLRVMAVAVSADTVGSAEMKSLIKDYFVVSSNLPMFAAPNDQLVVPVGITNNTRESGKKDKVSVELITEMEVLNDRSQVVDIGYNEEEMVRFNVKIKDELGSAPFQFIVKSGEYMTRIVEDISIRPSCPYMTDVKGGYLQNGKADIPVTRKMYPEYRVLNITASAIPLVLCQGIIKYLEKFPYGCTEQIVSQAFPALILKDRKEFGFDEKKIEANLKKAMIILQARQNEKGSFGFWAANSYYSDFQSVYAMHFLIEAKERGFYVNESMFNRGISFLKYLAEGQSKMESCIRNQSYAIYLLTRYNIVTTNYINDFIGRLESYDDWAKDLTGIYLAAAYKLLKKDKEADRLISDISLKDNSIEANYDYFYDSSIRDAQYLYIIARHFPNRLASVTGNSLLKMIEPIFKGMFNTLSSSYIVLGLDAVAGTAEQVISSNLKIRAILPSGKEELIPLKTGLFPVMDFTDKAKKLVVENNGDRAVFYQVVEAGYDKTPIVKETKQDLEVYREYRDEAGKISSRFIIGNKIRAVVRVRSLGKEHGNIAIVDMFPSGLDINIDESRNMNSDYTDIRDDRIIIYTKAKDSASEFSYILRASNKGDFVVPAIFAESMYDKKIRAISPGGRISVVDSVKTP